MAFGPPVCACCGAVERVEEHHLYLRAEGCPDDLTVWLCNVCHIRAATKAALAASKKTHGGARIGRDEQGPGDRGRQHIDTAHAGLQVKADVRACNLAPVVAAWRAAGVISQSGIARALNAAGIPTAHGGKWSDVQVAALLARIDTKGSAT